MLSVILDSRMVATQCMSIDNAEVTAIVATEGSRIVSRPISELSLPREITIAGVIRGSEGLLVGGSTLVMPGDHVVIFCVSGSLSGCVGQGGASFQVVFIIYFVIQY